MNADKAPAPAQFSIAPNRKVTLLCLITLPMLVSLGLWQLQRADDKRQRQAALEAVRAQPPASLPGTPLEQLREHRRLVLSGRYRDDRNWLLDNRQRNGAVGYEVLTPFELSDGTLLLVNRGWVAGRRDRSVVPNPPVPERVVTLFAEWRAPSDHPLLEGGSVETGWPKVALAIAPEVMARELGEPLADHYVRLDENSPGALTTDWRDHEITAARHLGYAVQWFAMALAVAIWFVLANTRLRFRRKTTTNSA